MFPEKVKPSRLGLFGWFFFLKKNEWSRLGSQNLKVPTFLEKNTRAKMEQKLKNE